MRARTLSRRELWFPVAVLVSLSTVVGCKQPTSVDKKLEQTQQVRETQKAQKRVNKAQELKQGTAMNWRVIAVAQSFASPGRKRIDALGDEFGWKVDVYEETGDNNYDRVDLDRDRDGKIDESWTYRSSRWEKFGGRLFWSGREWVRAGGGQVALPSVSTVTAGGEPLHKVAIEMLQHRAVDYEVADYFAGHGPKVSLKDADWDARWDSAEIDRDRDGVVDETWVRKGDVLTRTVIADKRSFRFREGTWQEQN